MDYVYLIYDVGNKLTKIGKSTNPIKRLSYLKISNSKLKLIWFGDEYSEKELHKRYKEKRIFREWFMLSKEDYLDITKNKKYIPHSLHYDSDRTVIITNNKTFKENTIMQEIVGEWTVKYKNWDLIITKDKEVYDVETLIKMDECWNNGSISYRIPKSNRKIGVKTINKHCIKQRVVLQENIPF